MKLRKLSAIILAFSMLFSVVYAEDVTLDLGSIFAEATSSSDAAASENTESTEGTEITEGTENTQTSQGTTDVNVPAENVDTQTQDVSNTENGETEAKKYFTDVPSDSPYAEAIAKMAESGIIDGYEDNSFRPENGVTRAEMCKMINLTFGYVDFDKAAGFPDVSLETDWFAPYVLAAQQQGYVEGYEDNSFRPSNNITRQEVCMIVYRIINPMPLPGLTVNITDEVSEWAKTAVESLVLNGIIPLEENNTFRAKENIKRYELASLLSLFVVPPAEPMTANVRFFNGETQIGETDVVFIGDYPTVPEAPAPSDNSYEFKGWRVVGSEELIDAANHMINADVDFEAVFAKKTFKVVFYDGKSVYETQTVEFGGNAVEPQFAPETEGYDFLGWGYTPDGEVVNVEDTTIEYDMEFYAIYEKSESDDDKDVYYDVTFYVDGEAFDMQSVLGGVSAKLPLDPNDDSKVFLGWALVEDGEESDVVDVENYSILKDTDFYAVFIENPNDPELISMLERGIEQLNDIALTRSIHKTARKKIVNCMKFVLADAQSGIFVDKEYINTNYGIDVEEVKTIVLDEMSGREASEFKTLLTNNVDKDVQDFLKEYFLDGEDIEI